VLSVVPRVTIVENVFQETDTSDDPIKPVTVPIKT
jgi:hypothetical protein